MDHTLIFSIIGAVVTLGGLFITIGVFKAKIATNEKHNAEQEAKIKDRATKDDLAKSIQRSDELLDLLRKRLDEYRRYGDGRYTEMYSILNQHTERIGKLEASQEQIFKLLDKLDASVTTGFHEVRDDMRELRKVIEQR
jgi:septation ring formation regulator EzrA